MWAEMKITQRWHQLELFLVPFPVMHDIFQMVSSVAKNISSQFSSFDWQDKAWSTSLLHTANTESHHALVFKPINTKWPIHLKVTGSKSQGTAVAYTLSLLVSTEIQLKWVLAKMEDWLECYWDSPSCWWGSPWSLAALGRLRTGTLALTSRILTFCPLFIPFHGWDCDACVSRRRGSILRIPLRKRPEMPSDLSTLLATTPEPPTAVKNT